MIGLPPLLADAHRELGLIEHGEGRTESARVHLPRYLALSPAAADRPIIESYLR